MKRTTFLNRIFEQGGRRMILRTVFSSIFVFLIAFPLPAEQIVTVPDPAKFPLPAGYQRNVDFWTRVYSEWKVNQMVIHDSRHLYIILDVIDFPESNSLVYMAGRPLVKKRMEHLKKVLLDLHRNPSAQNVSDDHKKLFQLYASVNEPAKFQKAAENLRIQGGVKDRFKRGLELMGLYIGEIRKVFREEGVPEEIAYLPLVESSFFNSALSKTKAAGIWQFMPGTARSYMTVSSLVDERLDPFIASRGAARYLRRSYNMFKSWPLAITSYNHGQSGIGRAIRTMGTSDFMTIYKGYEGPFFGFASRNFYAEFLAAYKVMFHSEKYFGDLKYEKPLIFETYKLSRPLYISSLTRKTVLTQDELRTYNPALDSSVIFSRRPAPKGYNLRIPSGRVENFASVLQNLGVAQTATQVAKNRQSGSSKTSATSRTASKTYVVKRGDTLYSISKKFSTSIATLRKINNLNNSRLLPGQELVVQVR